MDSYLSYKGNVTDKVPSHGSVIGGFSTETPWCHACDLGDKSRVADSISPFERPIALTSHILDFWH